MNDFLKDVSRKLGVDRSCAFRKSLLVTSSLFAVMRFVRHEGRGGLL